MLLIMDLLLDLELCRLFLVTVKNIILGNLNSFRYIIVIRDSKDSYRLKIGCNNPGIYMGDIQFLSIMEYKYTNYGYEV
jgi:hypothetical protein